MNSYYNGIGFELLYFCVFLHSEKYGNMVHDCAELMDYISQVGLLPLLNSGVRGFSADEAVAPECRYVRKDDGGWEWPLWQWKGPIVTEGHFAYGKFFNGKAGFVSMEWWPDLCNYRRAKYPQPDDESIEGIVLEILQVNGSMITRELRAACGFTGPKMRSRFDSYVTRLQTACRVVTEDFVYPRDKYGNVYGWGWALLATPERLFGRDACRCDRTPEESYKRLLKHLHELLPNATEKQIENFVG